MFYNQMRVLDCDLCENGFMLYDEQTTVDSYIQSHVFQSEDLNKVTEEVINQYLVFRCFGCGNIRKYTYKEIEKLIKKNVTKRVVRSIRSGQVIKAIPKMGRRGYMIYCGKCAGFDGNGACPSQIYNECEIKRFPPDDR